MALAEICELMGSEALGMVKVAHVIKELKAAEANELAESNAIPVAEGDGAMEATVECQMAPKSPKENSPKAKKEPSAECYVLPLNSLLLIATGTALKFGLPRIPDRMIQQRYKASADSIVTTIMVQNNTGTLWVDKYYVAYQLDAGPVRYTYISRGHIFEERASYQHARQIRGNPDIRLPQEIEDAFSAADNFIKDKKTKCWVANPWRAQLWKIIKVKEKPKPKKPKAPKETEAAKPNEFKQEEAITCSK